uniref:Uncharacterized protein n=1 Tax=Microcebus murinus TaxID=30608 RepID=A0A8C5XTQ1_MICMU
MHKSMQQGRKFKTQRPWWGSGRLGCVAESRASGLLKEKDPEPLSQQPQATSSGNKEALSPPVTLEYLPFFRTYGWLAEEEMGLQPEDSALPDGFFPYYCSQEESFPSLVLPTWTCGGSQDSPSRREARAGCFYRTTIRDGCSIIPSWPAPSSDRGSSGHWNN